MTYLLDLDQYRIKSHCHYEPSIVNTTNYAVFQVEIVNEELQRFYQGRFILEVWNNQGERIFQKILKDEISQWKLYNNVLIFKGSNESPIIYILYLEDRKMTAVRHPYDDNREVDMVYYDNYLIVAQQFNFRFIQINTEEISTTISQFSNPDESHQPLYEKEFSGIIQNDRIFQMIPNPLRNELLFLCVAENFQLIYYKFIANKQTEKRQVQLQRVDFDNSNQKKKSKLDKKQQKLLEVLHDIQQITLIVKNQSCYLLILRKNQVLEIVENFQQPIFVEQRLNMTKILPLFGEKVAFQFTDGSVQQAVSLEKISERAFITEGQYCKLLAMPPQTSTQHTVMSKIHFYEDAIIINQRLFLLRDNVIFVIDTFTKQVTQRFTQRQKVVSLHKLKSQTEDERGYKQTNYKIIALHKNGTFQVLQTQDSNLYSDWVRSEVNQTNILQQKEVVLSAFQNQNTFANLYITTYAHNATGSSVKTYQMLYNTQLIELNLKLKKEDNIFIVNSVSRQREMIGVVDVKYFAIYRNDKGNLVKLYQLNHTRFEFRDQINNHSLFYFQKEYILAISNKTIFKINVSSSQIEQSKLSNQLTPAGTLFVDAQCFYFITEGDQDGQSKLGVADNAMIEASFNDFSKGETKKAIVDKNNSNKNQNKLMYPTWTFENQIKRMDYDEVNNILNLHLTNYQVIQVPLLHRNTLGFVGMAERSYYLAFRKHGDFLYALDKGNYLNCWSMINGQLLSRTFVENADYKYYETDKDVYDKDWFQYSLVHRPNEASPNSLEDKTISQLRTYKILEIDQRGALQEKMTFVHPIQRTHNTHLYFSNDLNFMIEVLINKQDKTQSTYNLYTLENPQIHKWRFVRVLNENNKSIEWHHKSFFPYNLNLKTLEPVNQESIKNYDTYKFLDNERIKILNTQDGIEMIYNLEQKRVDSYMALQYSFTNTKESFYDKKCGHFYIQEVTSRLQNFYESLRRKIYLENKVNPRLRSLDVSARDYKYKYLIEQGYTNLDYQFYLQFIQGKDTSLLKTIKQMSNDHIQKFVHNIFPDGNTTVLHKIAESDKGFEVIDHLRQLAKKEGFVIPFMLNSEQLTPLDIAVQKRDFKQSNSLVKMLSKTPMDHHSRIVSHLIPKLIDMNLPALEKYFDKRRFQSGVCKTITLGRINIHNDQENKIVPTTLFNDQQDQITNALMNPKKKEQSINLEILDVPLHQYKGTEIGIKANQDLSVNEYEIRLVKSLANTDNQDLFNQKTIRAFIDYVWPHTRLLIVKNVFLPYLAFILYYMIYLVVLKKLNITQEQDPTFFNFTAGMFTLYEGMFKIILFLGCFYFFQQDLLQIKNFTNNAIVLWSYANIFPLTLMIFIIFYDLFIDSGNTQLEKTFYSASSFFIWIRVIHMMKCFDHTALLLRMSSDILHRMRYLIAFIIISLVAFGFTFYFVSEQAKMVGISQDTPFGGVEYMFYVLLGQYDAEVFDNPYLSILLVLVSFFNVFFIFTLIIALTVSSFSNNSGTDSNQAYQDKASLIALYSYLMTEFAIREPSKRYLLIATVTEGKRGKSSGSSSSFMGSGDMKNAQAKMMKNMDRRLNTLTVKVEKTLKDISDRLDSVSQQNQQQ